MARKPLITPEWKAWAKAIRRLFADAEDETVGHLAHRAEMSWATTSRVVRAEYLPPFPTAMKIVELLGGDGAHFEELWRAAASAQDRWTQPVRVEAVREIHAEIGRMNQRLEAIMKTLGIDDPVQPHDGDSD